MEDAEQVLPVGFQLAEGSLDSLALQKCNVVMPSVLDVRVNGSLQHLTDSLQRGADLKWDVTTMDLRCLNRYLGLDKVRFPKMTLHADTRLRQASRLSADALLAEGSGKAHLKGDIDLQAMAYQLNARIAGLQLHDFLPHDSLYLLTASARLAGRGTDFLSQQTKLQALVDIDHLGYGSWDLDSIHADCQLAVGKAMAEVSSRNDLLQL